LGKKNIFLLNKFLYELFKSWKLHRSFHQVNYQISGIVTPENKAADSDMAEDNKPYHILSYANGPGKLECFL
jgi:hypothetical protein